MGGFLSIINDDDDNGIRKIYEWEIKKWSKCNNK